jgi:hypothetical protein
MSEETEDKHTTAIPRWTPDFEVKDFDLQAVFREAKAQKKSAGKLLKSLGYPVAKFFSTDVPKFKSASADGTIPVTASSTAIDLSGDDFDLSAIEQMKAAAVGTTIFLNHEYDVPEDVYGKVAGAEIVRRKEYSPIAGQDELLSCLDLSITPVGADENPRAVQITNMLQKSKLKLGVSVTVLILEWKKRADGGRTITKVFYIESSMVGIPCNQTAWVQTAKSFKETVMAEITGAENNKSAQPGASAAKAMFADVLNDKQNNFYMYVDSLSSVVSRLRREARGKDAAAQAELVTEANTSVDEFAATMKAWIAEEIAEAAEKGTSSYYDDWYYYDAVSRVIGLSHKAGARNSGADQGLLDKAHDCLVEAGAACTHKEAEGDEAMKSASVAASAEAVTKAAELETKMAALELEKAELTQQLASALDAAEKAAELLELEKATSEVAVKALEDYSLQPLPRAGTLSVG